MDYSAFLEGKRFDFPQTGLSRIPALNKNLFDFQRDIVRWALKKGRACIFADCGLGKTIMQLEWARCVPGDVLILTPLAVAQQTQKEAERFGIEAEISRDGTKKGKITITNYEQLHKFMPEDYQGVVLDESSIIKSYAGKIRNLIIGSFRDTPYKLACTATPAPNDYMELGNHSEFVGAMKRVEMLATFFCHDGGTTSQWRLKGHAISEFWRWVATWAVMMKEPIDLGYKNEGFKLPPIEIHKMEITSGIKCEDKLFALPVQSLTEQRKVRHQTMDMRIQQVVDLIKSKPGPWIVWCELNKEGDELTKRIEGAVQIAGANSNEEKEGRMMDFTDGEIRILITKPKIAGFGMNWQHCNQMAFVGLSHSYEQFYQATRRVWRFGQKKPVDVYVVTTDIESSVFENIQRKKEDAENMAREMVSHMADINKSELKKTTKTKVDPYVTDYEKGEGWIVHLGDCVDVLQNKINDNTIDYTIFSPPFASLYVYSNSDRDMGNSKSQEEFRKHFDFLVGELWRVTKPGRLLSFHCMQLPLMKEKDGFIGLHDFRGELIRAFTSHDWIYHSEVCIWKDPVTQMQRTKALGLLHKQIRKDATMCRQGIADYLVTMRKPGDNPDRVSNDHESFPVDRWQKWASPIWTDINPGDTLQRESAREEKDERHIAPLQLGVIRRAIELWTNKGDLILSPFAGIGSEGYVSIQQGRKYIGIELKASYWQQACRNLDAATKIQYDMFAMGDK